MHRLQLLGARDTPWAGPGSSRLELEQLAVTVVRAKAGTSHGSGGSAWAGGSCWQGKQAIGLSGKLPPFVLLPGN